MVADIIVLKNGNRLRGTIAAEIDGYYVLKMAYGTMSIDKDDVEKVIAEREDEYLRKTGEYLLDHDDFTKGLEYLRQAYEKSPNAKGRGALLRALAGCAEKAAKLRRYRDVEKFVQEGLKLDRSDAALLDYQQLIKRVAQERERLEVLAASYLEDREYEQALSTFDQLIEEYPEDRERWNEPISRLSIVVGNARYRAQKYEQARDLYIKGLSYEPDLVGVIAAPLAYSQLQVAVPLLNEGAHQTALTQLRETYLLLPHEPAIVYYLAVAEESVGNLSTAADLYRILAGEENKTIRSREHILSLRRAAEETLAQVQGIQVTKPASRWDDAVKRPGRIDGRNFVINYTVRARAQAIERQLEFHLDRLRKKWFKGAQVLTKKVEVYIHPDHATYKKTLGAPTWSHGLTRHQHRFGKFFGHEMHFDASSPQFESAILPHELVHVLLPHCLGVNKKVPLWVDEGMATTEEPAFKQAYFDRVIKDAGSQGRLFSVKHLLSRTTYPSDEYEVTVFYAQSNSLVRFLLKKLGYQDAFRLFRTLTYTASIEDAIKAETRYLNTSHLERAWLKHIGRSQS